MEITEVEEFIGNLRAMNCDEVADWVAMTAPLDIHRSWDEQLWIFRGCPEDG